MLRNLSTPTGVLFAVLLISMSVTYTVKSVELTDLYLVKWPVNDQNKTTRWKASLAGFKQVLIRKSGSKEILRDDGVQKAYRKITNYLQRFEYIPQDDSDAEYRYSISLYFEPRLIDAIIRDAKLPLWGANRPLTVLWLAIEDNNQRQIVSAASSNEILPVIESNAVRRGLPLITPLMDLEDELAVTTSDVWGRFASSIVQASQRYFSDSLLIGRLQLIGENWKGQFTYVNQNQEVAFEASKPTQEEVIAEMTDKLAELLCDKYCVVEEVGENNEAILYLSGISSFAEFKAAEKYLEGLSALRKLSLVAINQGSLELRIALLGNLESLVGDISLSHLMTIEEPKVVAPQTVETESNNSNEETIAPDLEQSQILNAELEKLPLNGEKLESEPIKIKENSTLPILYYRWNG